MDPSVPEGDVTRSESVAGANAPHERCIIGIAGPMAAGKDLATHILAKKGFAILDADKLGHEALENENERILALFASEARKRNLSLRNDDGSINRRNLALIVFANKQNLASHEAIIHPQIDVLIEQHLRANPKTSYAINAAILHRFSVIKQCNCVLFITAPFIVRVKRVRKRNNMPFLQIFKRFYTQLQIFDKCKKLNADIYRVDNTGMQENLEHKIHTALNSCRRKG